MNKDYSIICSEPEVLRIEPILLSSRIDCTPFRLDYIKREEKLKDSGLELHPIGSLLRSRVDLTGGATPLGANYLMNGIRFIRTQDVDFNWINTDNCVFISELDNKKLKRSQLEIGDILLTITGVNFGKSAVVRDTILPANISQHSVRIHFKDILDPYFISTYLNSSYGQCQVFKNTVGVTRPAIDYEGIKSILIPNPLPEIQKYIGDKVRKVENLRNTAIQLFKEAESLINVALGLKWWEDKFSKKISNVRNINTSNIDNRIDAQFYISPYYELLNYAKEEQIPLIQLGKISRIGSGFPNSLDHGTIPYIRISDLDGIHINYEKVIKVTEEVFASKKQTHLNQNDLVVAITGATIGKTAIFMNNKIKKATLSSDTAFIRFKNIEDAFVYLLFFQTEIGQFGLKRGETGITNKHLATDYLKKLEIPKIKAENTKEISTKIISATNCILESNELIISAKKDVEDLIEGNFLMKEEYKNLND